MATYRPHHRLTVYAPRTVDPSEATILTPAAGALHSDAFKITTHPNLAGWKPYLNAVAGRRGRLDLLTKRTDTGEFQFQVLDVRTTGGGSNLERWFSQFHGNADDRPQWLGCKFFDEESLDDGVTWAAYATGRVFSVQLAGRIPFLITGRDLADDLRQRVFVGRPHANVSAYAHPTCLLPAGFLDDVGTYANFPAWTKPVSGKSVGTGFHATIEFGIVDADTANSAQIRALTAGLAEILEGVEPQPLPAVHLPGIYERRGQVITKVIREAQTLALARYDLFTAGATRRVRCRITHTSGAESGNTGTYDLQAVMLTAFMPRTGDAPVSIIYALQVGVLRDANLAADTGHPEYLPLPASGTTADVVLTKEGSPTAAAPLFLDDVLPGVLMRDLADGEFSALDADRAVQFPVPIDTTTADAGHGRGVLKLATLAADTSVPIQRYLVDGVARLDEVYERWFGPLGLGYRFTPAGALLALDLRMPTDLSGLLTIGTADLAEHAAPTWHHGSQQALREIQVRVYREDRFHPVDPLAVDVLFPLDDFAGVERGDRPYEIEIPGLRFAKGETINGQGRQEWAERWAQKLIQPLRWAYGAGPAECTLPCRRTSNTSGCEPGDLRLVNVDELPNPQTNLRGGIRVMRCVSREEQGLTLSLGFVDLGINAAADAPTVAAPAQETGNTKHGVSVAITRNAVSDPVVVEFAVTATSVGSRPAEASALWTFGMRTVAGGTVYLRPLASNSRVWIRARSEPAATDLPTMPSAWAFPGSGTGYVDTAAITAPSSLAVSEAEGKRALLTWVNGDAEYGIEVLLDGISQGTLAPVSTLGPGTKWRLRNLTVSTTYNTPGAQVRHFDRYGGVSAADTETVTTTGTAGTAPDADAPLYLLQGASKPVVPPELQVPILDFGVQLGVKATADTWEYQREVQRAPDSAGSPGTWAGLLVLPEGRLSFVDSLPPGAAFHYRYRLTAVDVTAGGWSAVVGPVYGVPITSLDRASVADVPAKRDDPLADGDFTLRAADTGGKEAFDDVFVLGTKTVKVGTAASPSAITKTLRLPVHLAMPFDHTLPIQCGLVYVQPLTANFLVDFLLPIFLPPGVTITTVRMRAYRQTTSDKADFAFHRVESDGNTSLASVVHSTTGWSTLSAAISEAVTAAKHYVFHVVLLGVAAAADGRGQWVEVEYTMPSYDKGV